MADSSVATGATGINIDTFTQASGDHRQAVVLGDATAAVTAAVNAAGELEVHLDGAGSATRTSVASSTTEAQVLAQNLDRHVLTVWNNSTATLYLGFGTTVVTSSNATVAIPSQGYYEAPGRYRGVVRAVWSAANGNAVFTETIGQL